MAMKLTQDHIIRHNSSHPNRPVRRRGIHGASCPALYNALTVPSSHRPVPKVKLTLECSKQTWGTAGSHHRQVLHRGLSAVSKSLNWCGDFSCPLAKAHGPRSNVLRERWTSRPGTADQICRSIAPHPFAHQIHKSRRCWPPVSQLSI